MWPDPELKSNKGPAFDANMPVEDLRLELDLSRAGVSSRYNVDAATPSDIHIFIVGCGGNGGHIVPQVFRYVRSIVDKQNLPPRAGQRTKKKYNFEITLMDGDTVEMKNLVRQNFIAPDIGKNKARVMAERYGRAFGLEVGIYDKYLNDTQAKELIGKCTGTVIILGCVDNNVSRAIIHQNLFATPEEEGQQKMSHLFWIDVANEMFDGQIVIGYRHRNHISRSGWGVRRDPPLLRTYDYWNERIVNKVDSAKTGLDLVRRGVDFPMPTFVDLYPSILNQKPDFDPDDPSCAENAAQVEQAMATNVMSASQMFSAFCQVMAAVTDHREEGEIPDSTQRRPRAFLMNFGHGGRSSTVFNTIRNLKNVFLADVPEEEDEDGDGE